MISLGIEGTAHTFGIGIFEDEKPLANTREMYRPKDGWGIHPSEAAKHHENLKEDVLRKALNEAGINLSEIDLVCYSAGPGLPPCLRVTNQFARNLAIKTKKPLMQVNHCIAHIEVGKLFTGSKDPVMIYVSGGNTQIVGFASGRYRVLGETQDMAIGNTIDTFIRESGLSYPGGPVMEKLAKKGKKYIKLPYVVKGMDLSFSGILTAAKQSLKKEKLEDLCFSFQETCFAMIIEVAERALAHTGKNELLLTGGVAANKRLSEMCRIMCKERGAKFYSVPFEYSGDNGAMIAWTGILAYKNGQNPVKSKNADFMQKWRTDEVEVKWIS
jgi:N6-L-threonylcarbamoyladenine synthase